MCKPGVAASLRSQVLVEKSMLGWNHRRREYKLEVMRDLADNVVIICLRESSAAVSRNPTFSNLCSLSFEVAMRMLLLSSLLPVHSVIASACLVSKLPSEASKGLLI
uniref:Carbamoyl phosphate synthase ATP-binding domain-containing protein n=1 Tax=Nelumbo nucifera TaxID=4432 RepID=A0A822YQN2_NELNU|nr:TPA_asm: hypothetical protein HUJ06_005532 [Nelumbo nucifera]